VGQGFCDDARFIKIDFLALGMLSLVEECVELIAVREERPPDLSRIDFETAGIRRSAECDTVGCSRSRAGPDQMIRRNPAQESRRPGGRSRDRCGPADRGRRW